MEYNKGGSRLERYNIKKYPKKQRLTPAQKALVALAIVLAVAIIGVLAWKSVFVRPELNGPAQTPSGPASSQTEPIDYGDGVRPRADGERKSKDFYSVLILGRDTGGGGNTDTMLLASYDVTNQKAAVMSIPRDTMVNVSWDVKKINSVYNMYGGGDKGIQAVYKEVSQLVGFEPDFKVVVEWEAVGKLVEAMGGVYFDVPYQMDYHDPYQDLVIEQDKGYRLLSGEDAMQVIRWRKNDATSPYGNPNVGDSGRMKIQQSFLMAVAKQMMTAENVKNIGKIAEVFNECVETDLSLQNILWFGQKAFAGGLDLNNIQFFTMPYKGSWAWSRSYQQNLDYVVPLAEELLSIVNELLSPFQEKFSLSDLDIMFTNGDGSVGSTTGYLEDPQAALPAPEDDPDDPTDDPGDDPNNPTEAPDDPENPVDPENPIDPEHPENPNTPENPEDPTLPGDLPPDPPLEGPENPGENPEAPIVSEPLPGETEPTVPDTPIERPEEWVEFAPLPEERFSAEP